MFSVESEPERQAWVEAIEKVKEVSSKALRKKKKGFRTFFQTPTHPMDLGQARKLTFVSLQNFMDTLDMYFHQKVQDF